MEKFVSQADAVSNSIKAQEDGNVYVAKEKSTRTKFQKIEIEETTTTQESKETDETATTASSSSKVEKTDSTNKKTPTSKKITTTTKKKVTPTTAKTTVRKTSSSGVVVRNGVTYINGILIANKTYALPSSYNPGVDSTAQSALNKMISAASNQGISLWVVSGFRSYSTQRDIYNNYVARDGKAAADRYSARPGHSEHQTGLAFDLNSLSQSFENTKEGQWLAKNCYKYGFIIRFPKGKENETGYMYEPWHVRYLGVDTATKVYNSGKSLERYLGITSQY
ncbi:MAG: M15 family metallopeptidase [Ruminococcus sp.]|nr:M15 family metallopeptidase [Candidatus Copronaster equi]